MALLDEPPGDAPARGRTLPLVIGVLVLVAAAGVGWWLLGPERDAAPSRPVSPRASERGSAPSPAVESPPRSRDREPAASPEPRRRARPRSEPAPEAPAPEPAAPARELVIEADVPGALVFVDRKFLGEAPVKTSDISAGTHRVNVSAEGFEGVARTVEVAESGPTSVTVRLKEVRLNEHVDVVHKHAVGSCSGRLTADLAGLRYAPERGDDGFTLPFGSIERFEIDYLEKNLRVKRKGGRTWNFESPTGSADPLFVFHREVEKARAKLSAAAAER